MNNPSKIEMENISKIKSQFKHKKFSNNFWMAIISFLPKSLRCKFLKKQLEDEKYLKRGLKLLNKSQDLVLLLRI